MNRRVIAAELSQRAGSRCEYCCMHEKLQGATFHVEHYLPKAKLGGDDLENLCYACMLCNQRKSIRTEVIDMETGDAFPIFNPRTQNWNDHFAFIGLEMIGLTPLGKAMIVYFNFNSAKRLIIREAERIFGLHPPD